MFSSLSHFLPAGLQPSSSPQKVEHVRDDHDEDDDPGTKSDTNDPGLHNKKKKDKVANETFIFVRPPPAKSNHPLNLQVQLVPPNARGPSGLGGANASRQSLDLSASAPVTPVDDPASQPQTPVTATPGGSYEQGAALTRTASTRSTASSTYSSTSTGTTASTSSSASSRRMIIPLYNLQAHNVMTNVIVDAGTDAKIAKFTKRGIEMLDLAVLEPVEVYAGGGEALAPGAGSALSARTLGARPSLTAERLAVPGGGSRPTTPDHLTNSSQASLASSSNHGPPPINIPIPTAPAPIMESQQTPQGKRKLFGNLFKKREAVASTEELVPPTSPSRGHARSGSLLGPRSVSPNPAVAVAAPARTSMSSAHRSSLDLGDPAAAAPVATVGARQPVLGLLPSISAPAYPPKGRPGLYVWTVKRWLKGEGGGLLAVARGMVKGQGEHGRGELTAEVEVRFEWKRGKGKAKRRKEKENGGEARRQASSVNLSGTTTPTKRLSMNVISRQSSFSTTAASEDGHDAARRSVITAEGDGADSGDESDPEDSETPWTCTVKVRRLGHVRATSPATSPGKRREKDKDKEGVLRIKVVAMLKVPFPLPDVDVDRMVVRKREVGPGSLGGTPMKPAHGLVITAEEIKDVVCSTGLWLVVREGFGGIGKVNRKGDGWRIRG
ncbi:hypothetical protein FB45DRAFT_948150 [Roridomyces roridus]|uniref:Uncharacterized protein n=1 Tax=Roridomyces roridus TaxID=1738132 RepID=A0AAD7B1J9_9AGAR|nr:hypothetical protein FB45DRAFT_948150 [Roridomyces roridus]